MSRSRNSSDLGTSRGRDRERDEERDSERDRLRGRERLRGAVVDDLMIPLPRSPLVLDDPFPNGHLPWFFHRAVRLHRRELHTTRSDCSLTQKCYDPGDATLTFVDREDELDFLYEGFSSRRALMSCGHAVTPMSLTSWCRRLLDQGESSFVCGANGCNAEWPYVEVCKMALLTPEEKTYFERTMDSNAARDKTKSCPGCKSSVERQNESDLRVRCTVCTGNRGRAFDFCWQCLREWKGPAPQSDHCKNDGCNESLKTLRMCPRITFHTVNGINQCPSIRACPSCGLLMQHDRIACPNVNCPRCKERFCFVCLSVNHSVYSCRLAPRQTSIPAWQKK